jgi:hypothetical protein
MTESLASLTASLNQVLDEETRLLDALDLAAAGRLVGRKRDAVLALQAALSAESAAAELAGEEAEALREGAAQLVGLSEANRVAVERGLALQMRLIKTIAQCVPRARAADAPIYQSDGTQQPPRPPEAYAFLSRM